MAGRSAQIPTVNSQAGGSELHTPGRLSLDLSLVRFSFLDSADWRSVLHPRGDCLSLTLLAGYGGMVSLAQLSVSRLRRIYGGNLGLLTTPKWAWDGRWIPTVLMANPDRGDLWDPDRGGLGTHQGIYTIMITLAISVGFYYFLRQNYPIFNGWNGFAGLKPPVIAGVNMRAPTPFYYLSLGVAAAAYAATVYLGRSTFGLSLQAYATIDRRMRALGFNVTAHRILAYSIASPHCLPGRGASRMVEWTHRPGLGRHLAHHQYSDHSGCGRLGHPIGAFLGAVLFILLENFAIDLIARERFNLLIGAVFLAIVLFSPDGILGVVAKIEESYDPA